MSPMKNLCLVRSMNQVQIFKVEDRWRIVVEYDPFDRVFRIEKQDLGGTLHVKKVGIRISF